MSDRSAFFAAFLTLVASALLSLFARRVPVWVHALRRLTTLLLLTALAQHFVGAPWRPRLATDGTWDRIFQQGLVLGWWLVAARTAAGAAHLLLNVQNRSRETQILSDLVGVGIYGATVLAIIDAVFAVPVTGLIATSGVIAVVIGLALQSTLSDVFSGIAIDIERPYRAGDRLWVDGGIEGRVKEVNWRSTLIVTGNGDLAVVPNSVMAKSRLVNHSLPTTSRSLSIEVRLDARAMPERCVGALEAAVRACLHVESTPEPSVNLKALAGDGATYEINFWVSASEYLSPARSEFLAQVHRHLLHAAIPLAVPGDPALPELALPTAADLLARSDLFSSLSDADRGLLASRMVEVAYEANAVLFRQGDAAGALYLLAAGTVGILRRQPDGNDLVRRLGPGTSLGIVGLTRDTSFAVTATALTAVRAWQLARIIHDGGDGLSASGEASPGGCANARDRRPCCWPGIGC